MMMKTGIKRVALALGMASALLCASTSSAQTHYNSNVSIGAHGGVDMSRIFFNPSVKQSFLFGATGGLGVRYIEEKYFGLIAELNFEQRGWKNNFEEAPYSYSRTLNYMQIPVMAHIYVGQRGRFFFNAGPVIGVLIGDSYKSNFNIDDIASLPDFPTNERTDNQFSMPIKNKVDYGICAGLGGEFSINKRNSLYLEIRGYYGLGNIFSSKRTEIFRASNALSISANVGYWFRVK